MAKDCVDCGKSIPNVQTYCKDCAAARDRLATERWKRAHPEKNAEYLRKSRANKKPCPDCGAKGTQDVYPANPKPTDRPAQITCKRCNGSCYI